MAMRNGKIARLPRHIRDQLNHRLEDGEDGREILDWLNGLYDVKEILKDRFHGQPVNKQNLSDWRQGGFRDWQRRQESNAFLRDMIDHSDELDDLAGSESLADRAARLVVANSCVCSTSCRTRNSISKNGSVSSAKSSALFLPPRRRP